MAMAYKRWEEISLMKKNLSKTGGANFFIGNLHSYFQRQVRNHRAAIAEMGFSAPFVPHSTAFSTLATLTCSTSAVTLSKLAKIKYSDIWPLVNET